MTSGQTARLAPAIRLGAVMLLFCYLYALVKIIWFKFGEVSMPVLARQLLGEAALPGNLPYRWHAVNLVPFRSISVNLHRLSEPHDLVNLFGNIALFIPLGVFVVVLTRSGWIGMAVRAFALSLALESAQLVFRMGSFDVDDLLLNTLGGLLGYGLCRAMIRIVPPLPPDRTI